MNAVTAAKRRQVHKGKAKGADPVDWKTGNTTGLPNTMTSVRIVVFPRLREEQDIETDVHRVPTNIDTKVV
tara:strand:- start:2720 stop:2932 length:213 start_codon:yes stop_codon:yes gene_type:complete